MLKAIIFGIAIYITLIVISRTLNSLVLIIKAGKSRSDSNVGWVFELIACGLWGLFYYLTHC